MIRTTSRSVGEVVEQLSLGAVEATKLVTTTIKMTRKSYLPAYALYGDQLVENMIEEQPLLKLERKIEHESRLAKLAAKRDKIKAKAAKNNVSLDMSEYLK